MNLSKFFTRKFWGQLLVGYENLDKKVPDGIWYSICSIHRDIDFGCDVCRIGSWGECDSIHEVGSMIKAYDTAIQDFKRSMRYVHPLSLGKYAQEKELFELYLEKEIELYSKFKEARALKRN